MTLIVTKNSGYGAEAALALHRHLLRFTHGVASAFLWVFTFEYFSLGASAGHALIQTFLLFALAQSIAMLVVPFAAARMRHGMLRGLVWGTTAFAVLLVYAGAFFNGLFPHGTALIGVLLGLERGWYRVPYAVERSIVPARSVSLVPEILIACGPLLFGVLLIANIPPFVLFFFLGVVAVAALLPLPQVPNVYERFSWGYRETFQHFAAPEHRGLLLASLRRGAFSAILFLIWPLTLLFATRSFFYLGAFFSLTLLIVLGFNASRRRAAVEFAGDARTYVDELSALKEMGLSAGALFLAFACAGVLALAGF